MQRDWRQWRRGWLAAGEAKTEAKCLSRLLHKALKRRLLLLLLPSSACRWAVCALALGCGAALLLPLLLLLSVGRHRRLCASRPRGRSRQALVLLLPMLSLLLVPPLWCCCCTSSNTKCHTARLCCLPIGSCCACSRSGSIHRRERAFTVCCRPLNAWQQSSHCLRVFQALCNGKRVGS